MISTIILDFDGVILESVTVKTEAFRTLFSFVPEHVDEIVQFHKDNGGMSRFDKFQYIYKNILKEDLTQSKFNELSKKFVDIVFKEVIKAPYVPGAKEFLETYHSKIPLYVVSATPEEELIQIIQKRGMSHYFKKVFGAPRKKAECISEIVKLTGSPPEYVIFIGDAKNDFEAARAAGVRFIGRIKPGDENRFSGLYGVEAVIPNMYELARYIEVHQ
ncbi:MAG: HAD family hydrolase [Methanomicrobiales archaeon]|nr:HAD family hydrolase [Methanomicrobiales archaeon]